MWGDRPIFCVRPFCHLISCNCCLSNSQQPFDLFIQSATMPCKVKRRKKICRHRRSPTYTTNRHKEQAQSSTKAEKSGDSHKTLSDSPDDEAPSTDNMGSQRSQEENSEATSQVESTEEYSSQEDTPISEASRSTIRLEMMRCQLNFWEQQRRKWSSKRHSRGTNWECYKRRRKSRRFIPLPKTKHIPMKVLPEEPATNSHEKIATDEQPSISNSLQHQRTKPPDAAPRNTRGQLSESPSIPSEHLTEYPANHPVSQTAEPPSLKPDSPSPIEITTHPSPAAWTLLARLPADHTNLLDYLIEKLSQQPEITEVTKEETIGGSWIQTSIRIKGSIQALYAAHADLETSGQQDVTWEEHPPSLAGATNSNRWQTTHWETAKTYSPHPGTPEPSKRDKKAGEKPNQRYNMMEPE